MHVKKNILHKYYKQLIQECYQSTKQLVVKFPHKKPILDVK